MPDRVLDQVRCEAADQAPVAGQDGRLQGRGELDVAGARLGLLGPQRLADDRREVDPFTTVDPALALREREQRVDQLLLLLGLLEHLPAGVAERGDRRLGSVRTISSSARAAVSGVRSSCEAFATNRRCASKAPFEALEQAIDRVSELAELVPWSLEREPPVEVGFGDLLRGGCHRAQRTQRTPGDQPAERRSRSAP